MRQGSKNSKVERPVLSVRIDRSIFDGMDAAQITNRSAWVEQVLKKALPEKGERLV